MVSDAILVGRQMWLKLQWMYGLLIGGLHLTSQQPCWCTNPCSEMSFGNLMLLLCKNLWNLFCFVHQHDRLITWIKTKDNSAAKRQMSRILNILLISFIQPKIISFHMKIGLLEISWRFKFHANLHKFVHKGLYEIFYEFHSVIIVWFSSLYFTKTFSIEVLGKIPIHSL